LAAPTAIRAVARPDADMSLAGKKLRVTRTRQAVGTTGRRNGVTCSRAFRTAYLRNGRCSLPSASIFGRSVMEFMITGFRQKDGIRRLLFTGSLAGMSREFGVDADVALLRRYGIALQELPLLCRRLLENDALRQDAHVLTFSEDLMREHAEHRATIQRAAEERRKNHRRPLSRPVGQHWRNRMP